MYAVKPWGKVVLVGSSVGTYAMGIGMRWRESNVHIVERRADPRYELANRRRCVLTNQTVRLMTDLGCTREKIETILHKAKGWRFLRPDLETIKSGVVFPGCAEGEMAYHCTEGLLMRILRTEFLRFGGNVSWATEAFDAFESEDGSGLWSLRKMYGLETDAEAIITTAKGTAFARTLMVDDPDRIAVLFDENSGIFHPNKEVVERIFGLGDVAIVVGLGLVIHMWHANDVVAWKALWRGQKRDGDFYPSELHPVIRGVIENSVDRQSRVLIVPATTPTIKDSATHVRLGVLGDGLLPVDPFEWRGDRARCLIEEASALCRAFYGKKYHRGNAAYLLRGIEQDSLAKRASLLRRDLEDAERFLEMAPVIEEGGYHVGTLERIAS